MVGERRVRLLLHRVRENLTFLDARAALDRSAVRFDEVTLHATKYGFIIVIEACLHVAQHVCAAEGWGPPANNADAMRVLGRHDVLTPELADRMAATVGFRNLLVHQYVEVNDDIVVASLDDLGDIRAFVAAVSEWLVAHPEE